MRAQGMENFKKTGIYALTAENLSQGRNNIAVVELLIRSGIKFIQYREKEKTLGAMYEECQKIRELTRRAGVTFIVNDHIDLALAVDADGVHVGQGDLPPAVCRRLIGPGRVLGLSTHDKEQFRRAAREGIVDYAGVGPVYATQTKKDAAAVGLEYVRFAAAENTLPFVAIGGIKLGNLEQVAAAGARTAAIVSDIVGAADIPEKIAALQAVMKKSIPQVSN